MVQNAFEMNRSWIVKGSVWAHQGLMSEVFKSHHQEENDGILLLVKMSFEDNIPDKTRAGTIHNLGAVIKDTHMHTYCRHFRFEINRSEFLLSFPDTYI